MKNFAIEDQEVVPGDFAGKYSFYQDGWHGTLSLNHREGRELTGDFYADRFDEVYKVTALVDERITYRISIDIYEYNWMDKQSFTGYLFTCTKNAMAGYTEYEYPEENRKARTPFGFFARKTGSLFLKSDFEEESSVEPEDFAGRYSLNYNGWHGTLHLQHVKDKQLIGSFYDDDQKEKGRVTAEVDERVRHGVSITIYEVGETNQMVFTGYLFMRPKNVIAGEAKWKDMPFGFYMTKW